jgi:DNA (cytosine-5)-methyltransferase 1
VSVYYNENDPKAAAWLRELIKEGHLPEGYVDERSILDVRPHEVAGYRHQHYFAGIGGWPLALKLAGWPADRPVRTGSCPCQPFSDAGKQLGEADERHLWPVFKDLITFGEPAVTFGEQVASKLGREWLAGVRADLEAVGYEVGAADLCAACTGALHIRQRLYWVANPNRKRRHEAAERKLHSDGHHAQSRGDSGGLVDAQQSGLGGYSWDVYHGDQPGRISAQSPGSAAEAGGTRNFWSDYELINCRDGKARRTKPGIFPLAPRILGSVALLRGAGNAIVPQLAATFIKAFLDVE